jgi:hypothetical protein
MPITRISPEEDADNDIALDVFQIQEAIEVYDGALALAVDHLLNHIKVMVSLAYLPASEDLDQALNRHPLLRRKLHQLKKDRQASGESPNLPEIDGRSLDRVLLGECQRLLDGVREIAHLAAWPETAGQAEAELEQLRREVPFLDYRYDNDPFPSDRDHEERGNIE